VTVYVSGVVVSRDSCHRLIFRLEMWKFTWKSWNVTKKLLFL